MPTTYALIAAVIASLGLALFRARPTVFYATAAVLQLLGGVAGLLALDVFSNGAGLHDTYYVVANARILFGGALAWSVLSAVVWFQSYLGAIAWPRTLMIAFWAMLLSSALNAVVVDFMPMPRRYLDYQAHFALRNSASTALSLVALAGLCLFAAQLVASAIRRWRQS